MNPVLTETLKNRTNFIKCWMLILCSWNSQESHAVVLEPCYTARASCRDFLAERN